MAATHLIDMSLADLEGRYAHTVRDLFATDAQRVRARLQNTTEHNDMSDADEDTCVAVALGNDLVDGLAHAVFVYEHYERFPGDNPFTFEASERLAQLVVEDAGDELLNDLTAYEHYNVVEWGEQVMSLARMLSSYLESRAHHYGCDSTFTLTRDYNLIAGATVRDADNDDEYVVATLIDSEGLSNAHEATGVDQALATLTVLSWAFLMGAKRAKKHRN